jgi:hypothetical protein
MSRNLACLACLLGLLATLAALPARADEKKGTTERKVDERDKVSASTWMTKKLEYSQQILAGLTRGDFALVRKNADGMVVVGILEKYDRSNNREYRRQIRYFDDAVKELIHHAEKKNLNGATLAYTQLTLSCVHCHTLLRDRNDK